MRRGSVAAWLLWAGALVLCAGCDEERMVSATPEIGLRLDALDFGRVRTGRSARLDLPVSNQGRAPLALQAVRIEDDPTSPGGASAFRVEPFSDLVATQAELGIAFAPESVGDFRAHLVLESDDPDLEDRRKVVRLLGRGAEPRLSLIPACAPPCTEFQARQSPPVIDFGPRMPLRRGAKGFVEPAWPTITVSNDGELPAALTGAAFRGDQAFWAQESLTAQGLVVEPGGSYTVHVSFEPQGAGGRRYDGELVVTTDDPGAPSLSVALTGELAPNRPPRVCAAIVEVHQPDGSVSYPRAPGGTIAFGGYVPVQPGKESLVLLSAFSEHFTPGLHPHEADLGDPSACTTDPEDGREALRYRWEVITRPAESSAELIDATHPEPRFRPDAIGRYLLRLTVTDPWEATASSDVEFEALPVRDLALQLAWTGHPGVDLDLHLVKPGPCGDRADCLFDRRGDLNGFHAARGVGLYDWGLPGMAWDDPRLDLDDQGDGALLEIANLNYPQNDPACRQSRCVYDVYVHYFKDWRSSSLAAPACPEHPCAAGSGCGCDRTGAGADAVCVAGRCVRTVRAEVKLYVQTGTAASPTAAFPAAGEELRLPSPCTLWHVARIAWPSLEELSQDPRAAATVVQVGEPAQRSLAFFGSLSPKALSCAPNTPPGTPDQEVTFGPGQVPVYP